MKTDREGEKNGTHSIRVYPLPPHSYRIFLFHPSFPLVSAALKLEYHPSSADRTTTSSPNPPTLPRRSTQVSIAPISNLSLRLILRSLRLPPRRILQQRRINRPTRQMHVSNDRSTYKHIARRALNQHQYNSYPHPHIISLPPISLSLI